MYPVTVDSPRVTLRELAEDDLDATLEIVGDPEVTRSLTYAARTREQQERALAAQLARSRARPRADYYLAAVERHATVEGTDAAALVGLVRLTFEQPPGAELGYAVRRAWWGRGYATEIAATMVEFAFSQLGVHRIQAACGPDNAASQRVLAKLGFRYEGRLRENVFAHGGWRDSLLYAVLEQEWQGPEPLGEEPPGAQRRGPDRVALPEQVAFRTGSGS